MWWERREDGRRTRRCSVQTRKGHGMACLNSFLSSPGDPDGHCDACKFCFLCRLLCSPKGLSSMHPEVWDEETFWFVPEVLVLEVKLLIRTEKSFWFGRNQYLRQGLNWAQENNGKIKRLKTDWETKMAKYHGNRKLFSGKNTMNSYILLIKQWTHSRLAMYNIYVIPQFWNASYCGLS